MTIPTVHGSYVVSNGIAPDDIAVPVFATTAPTQYDSGYPLGKRWIDSANNKEYTLVSFSTSTGQLLATWLPLGTVSGPILTLTGDTGGLTGTAGTNINVQGNQAGHLGAISFDGQGLVSGQIYARVLPDNVSLDISAAGLLEKKNFYSGTATTAINGTSLITWSQLASTDITLAVGKLYYVRLRIVGRDQAGTNVVIGGREESVITTIVGGPVVNGPGTVEMNNIYFAENPAGAGSGTKDYNILLTGGNLLQVQCVGASAADNNVAMTWYAELELINV